MLYAFKCLFYVTLTILLLVMIDFINCWKQEIRKILPMLEVQSNLLREDTRQLVSRELGEMRYLLASELENTRAELKDTTLLLDSRLASIQDDLNTHLLVVGDSLDARADALQLSIDSILQPMASVATELEEAAPMFLDCEFNPNCFFNRWVGMGQGIERASYATADMAEAARDFMKNEFPILIDSSVKISDNIEKGTGHLAVVAEKLATPAPWYQRILSYAVSGAYIFRVYDLLTGDDVSP